jgi:hypothetical protein
MSPSLSEAAIGPSPLTSPGRVGAAPIQARWQTFPTTTLTTITTTQTTTTTTSLSNCVKSSRAHGKQWRSLVLRHIRFARSHRARLESLLPGLVLPFAVEADKLVALARSGRASRDRLAAPPGFHANCAAATTAFGLPLNGTWRSKIVASVARRLDGLDMMMFSKRGGRPWPS